MEEEGADVDGVKRDGTEQDGGTVESNCRDLNCASLHFSIAASMAHMTKKLSEEGNRIEMA